MLFILCFWKTNIKLLYKYHSLGIATFRQIIIYTLVLDSDLDHMIDTV